MEGKNIKIVEYQGRIDPFYKEVGEIKLSKVPIGRFNEEEELCIDIEDLLDWIEYRTCES